MLSIFSEETFDFLFDEFQNDESNMMMLIFSRSDYYYNANNGFYISSRVSLIVKSLNYKI